MLKCNDLLLQRKKKVAGAFKWNLVVSCGCVIVPVVWLTGVNQKYTMDFIEAHCMACSLLIHSQNKKDSYLCMFKTIQVYELFLPLKKVL